MKIALIGTVGVPGRYGGFETLADNLVRYHDRVECPGQLTVYCSGPSYPEKAPKYLSAKLRYSRFKANGAQSVIYDIVTMIRAVFEGHNVLLVLGVSGAVLFPIIRLVSRTKIITNVDGIEWRRDKWKGLARWFLRFSEKTAVRFSHRVIADNQGIADWINESYGVKAEVIAYGGDNAVEQPPSVADSDLPIALPADYALALCRIEPENNIEMILEAFASAGKPLAFVGNWANSDYGRDVRTRFESYDNIFLIDPIYDAGPLYQVRAGAASYIHGHSAGGTNPSLVEMMHFGIPVVAFDCVFNRNTTENRARFFSSAADLAELAAVKDETGGDVMLEIARRRYVWDTISREYFDLLQAA